MTKLDIIRAALLVLLGMLFLAFDLYVAYGSPQVISSLPWIDGRLAHNLHFKLTNEYRVLALLHGELAVVLCGAVLWPQRRRLRWALCGLVLAMTCFAMARLCQEHFLFQPTLMKQLSVAVLMVLSFSLPCAGCFLVYRWRSPKRLVLLGRGDASHPHAQFGIRHLLMLTAGCAFVALAGRPIVPAELTGQFALQFDRFEFSMLSLLCFFPGLAAGPLGLLVLRPSWRMVWVLLWIPLLATAELFIVDWFDPSSLATQSLSEILHVAFSIATGYLDLAVVVIVLFCLMRLGGLRLAD